MAGIGGSSNRISLGVRRGKRSSISAQSLQTGTPAGERAPFVLHPDSIQTVKLDRRGVGMHLDLVAALGARHERGGMLERPNFSSCAAKPVVRLPVRTLPVWRDNNLRGICRNASASTCRPAACPSGWGLPLARQCQPLRLGHRDLPPKRQPRQVRIRGPARRGVARFHPIREQPGRWPCFPNQNRFPRNRCTAYLKMVSRSPARFGRRPTRFPAISAPVRASDLQSVGRAYPFSFHVRLIADFPVGQQGLGSQESGAFYVVYIIALFASVLAHELGHAVVGRRYGVRTVEIMMFPIGGVSRLERQPKPQEELWIALAGPLVNLLTGGVLLQAILAVQNKIVDLKTLTEPTDANLLERIAAGNLILAAFNLLPAFPMDGGRVLRALLTRFWSEEEATRMASWMGRMMAMGLGLYGLLSMHFMLVFIAFFVYLGAAQEGAAAMGRFLTHGIPVRAAMMTEYHTLSHGNTVRDAANLLVSTSQQDFPVVHAGRVIGLLGRNRPAARDGRRGPRRVCGGCDGTRVSNVVARHGPSGGASTDGASRLLRAGNAGRQLTRSVDLRKTCRSFYCCGASEWNRLK